jgi:iron complex outermembrane receptor protein
MALEVKLGDVRGPVKDRCFKRFFMVQVLVLFCLFQLSWAGEGKVYKLDNVVVAATKTEQNIEDAPGSITVISKEDMELRSIKTVDEALSELAGVFVKRTKGLMDSTSSLHLRGFNSDRYTLILMDGMPMNDAYTGGVEWGMLPVGNIEKIEVVRGAASALYGGNAMGGVINIITKSPEELEVTATAGYGTNNTRRYRLGAGSRITDKLSLRAGYEEESTDGYVTTPVVRTIKNGDGTIAGGYPMENKDGTPGRWVVGDKGENGAEKQSFDIKAVLEFSDTGELSFSALRGIHEYDYGAPNSYMTTFGDTSTSAIAGSGKKAGFRPNDFISYTGISENETDMYNLAFKEVFGPVAITAQAGTTRVDDRYTTESGSGMADYYDSPGKLNITENASWFSEIRGDVAAGDSHFFTLGVSFRTDESDTNSHAVPFYRSFSGRGESTYYAGGKEKTWSLFIQDEWKIADSLTLYLGGRYDSFEVYDGASGTPGSLTQYKSNTESQFSPKVSMVWKPLENTRLRSSVGQAFRSPTLYELYRTWSSWGVTYQSNPDLKPETVTAYEMGVDQSFFDKKTRFSLTLFQNEIDDLIYNRIDGNIKKRVNAGKARTRGLEAQISQEITPWLTLWGNYTFTDAKIKENSADPESEGEKITGIPDTAFNIGLDATWKQLKGSVVSRYYSKIYNESDNSDTEEGVYGTYEPALYVDAKLIYSPCKWADLSVSVDNLFDEEYFEYYQCDGRTVFCELTLKY